VDEDFHLEVIQVKEERDKKKPKVGFRGQKPQRREKLYGSCRMIFSYIFVGNSLDSCGYLWVTKGKVMDFHGSKKEKS
jgi:hypothetical protein